jgi:hypothetical protein
LVTGDKALPALGAVDSLKVISWIEIEAYFEKGSSVFSQKNK